MNTNVRKRVRKKPVLIIIMLAICLITFLSNNRAFASNTQNTTSTKDITNSSTNETETKTPLNKTADRTKDSKKSNTGTNQISGSLGPLQIALNTDENSNGLAATLQMLMVLTVISLAPSILIMVTSFTRILIVLHFVRSAIGTQTTPPNQILIGLSLFLTFFLMSSTFSKINTEAIQPLSKGEITQEEAYEKGIAPIRDFMMDQMKHDYKELSTFMDIAKIDRSKLTSTDDIPITVIIPAFIISELKKAFIIGFIIYIPFLIIDMVVASTLMSMGMMMLPPTMISMPFKILLFILADGWTLIIGSLVKTFN